MPKLDFELSRARGSGASENGGEQNVSKPPPKKFAESETIYISFVH